MKKYGLPVFLIFVTVLAFIYRVYGVKANQPFWVDEFSAAKNARYFLKFGLGAFTNPFIVVERHNITTHALIALFFRLLGQKEWVARLPIAIIGSLLPLSVFY